MARARNIKPGFYKNPELVECSVWARLIFPGLWMLADREGRLEDRPKQIKMELLPADPQDVSPLLQELESHGLIQRYSNDDGHFIQITKFLMHQSPHFTEKASRIKPPDSGKVAASSATDNEKVAASRATDSWKEPALNGHENARSMVALPPSSLIPSSLIPSSLIPEENTKIARKRAAPSALVSISVLLEAGFDGKSAQDFIDHKTRVKAPLTARAWSDHETEAKKAGWSAQQAAEKVMAKNWKGFEAKYVERELHAVLGSLHQPTKAERRIMEVLPPEMWATHLREWTTSQQSTQEVFDVTPIALGR